MSEVYIVVILGLVVFGALVALVVLLSSPSCPANSEKIPSIDFQTSYKQFPTHPLPDNETHFWKTMESYVASPPALFMAPTMEPPPNIVYVTFGNTGTVYYANGQLAQWVHSKLGFPFSSSRIYTEIDVEQAMKTLPTDAQAVRGYYYWAWKPWILQDTLQHVPEGSIVVYGDSSLFLYNREAWKDALSTVQQQGYLFFRNPQLHLTAAYCKCEAFEAFEKDDPGVADFNMVDASLLFLKNSPESRAWVQQWIDFCWHPFWLSDVSTNTCTNVPDFKDHRHDQALLTAVLRNHNLVYPVPKGRLSYHHYCRRWQDLDILTDRLQQILGPKE